MSEEELFCKLFPEYSVNGKPLSPYFDCFESGYEQAKNRIADLEEQLESERDLPAIAYMQGAEKQKKKDEEELKKWKDEWQEQVQKATDEGYARTLQTIQLSKARDIIKNLMVYVPVDLKEYEEAKQFLKECK